MGQYGQGELQKVSHVYLKWFCYCYYCHHVIESSSCFCYHSNYVIFVLCNFSLYVFFSGVGVVGVLGGEPRI